MSLGKAKPQAKVARISEISERVGVYFKVLGFSDKMECDVYG